MIHPFLVLLGGVLLISAIVYMVYWILQTEERELSKGLVAQFEAARYAKCSSDLDRAHAAVFDMLITATRPSIALRAAMVLRYINDKRRHM